MLRATDRVIPHPETDAFAGQVRLDPGKTLWLGLHLIGGLVGVLVFPSWSAAALFLVLTALTICAGHSVGMRRLLIHRSFKSRKGLEYGLVWLGTLVGMAGPMGMIRTHDLRDWHQRQVRCPDHPAHRAGFWCDAVWQLSCRYDLDVPPRFQIEPEVAQDPVYIWMERLWWLQAVPIAGLLWLCGGWAFVLWGLCLRISVSLIGHWAVGHFAHRRGYQGWSVDGVSVQGFNLPGLGLITFGENWHGNHHAFPHSARLGIEPGQLDPGYGMLCVLERLGLVWGIQGPRDGAARDGVRRVVL